MDAAAAALHFDLPILPSRMAALDDGRSPFWDPRYPWVRQNPDEFLSAKWIPPAWPWVDPLKDGQAELLHVRAGFKSRIDTVNERGSDIEEVDEEISAGNKSADDRGLVLDSDPRRVSKTGVSQTNDPIPEDEDETNREVA